MTHWNRQAKVGCHRRGSCGCAGRATRGLHHCFNQGCQWVDGGGAFGSLQRHRVGHAGIDIHATDGDDAATGGTGRDEEVAAGVSGADKIVGTRVCCTVVVGIDVNGSATHIAVSHYAAGEAHCVIAGQVLDGRGIVASRGVGVAETDCTGTKSAGHGKCHDRTNCRNAGHRVGTAAGCYREGSGGRKIRRVKRAVVGQFNCFCDAVCGQRHHIGRGSIEGKGQGGRTDAEVTRRVGLAHGNRFGAITAQCEAAACARGPAYA